LTALLAMKSKKKNAIKAFFWDHLMGLLIN